MNKHAHIEENYKMPKNAKSLEFKKIPWTQIIKQKIYLLNCNFSTLKLVI